LSIDFLAIGCITQDRIPGGFRLGGTVSYASIAALRLGRRPGILTRAAEDAVGLAPVSTPLAPGGLAAPLAGIAVHCLPSPVSLTFNNMYDAEGHRVQLIEAIAAPIEPAELPPAWADVPLVLLAPLAEELSTDWASQFPNNIMALTIQGWLRTWDGEGHVFPSRWRDPEPFLRRADIVVFSIEDVQGNMAYVRELAAQARLLIVTEGRQGCTVYLKGVPHHVPPRPAREVDPTGAGDVFAAAFMIRLAETGDPLAAGRFANVAASISVEAPGMDSVPYRDQVDMES
jgi:1D-myo-inositol 3-kinase